MLSVEYIESISLLSVWMLEPRLPAEEMGTYIADALAKMNVFLATEKPIDIITIIEEERLKVGRTGKTN